MLLVPPPSRQVSQGASPSTKRTVFWVFIPTDVSALDREEKTLESETRPPLTVHVDEPQTCASLELSVSPVDPVGGSHPSSGRNTQSPPLLPCGNLHILLVDDEMVNRSVAQRMLKRIGCTTVELSDGDEVEAVLRCTGQLPSADYTAREARPFDVLLLDIQMRRMNGDVLCQRLRAAGLTVPIVAATGNCSQLEVKSYMAIGFTAVIPKPFSHTDLHAVLAEVSGSRPSG